MEAFFENFGWALKIALVIYWAVALILIISENRNPASTFAWIIVFFVFPFIGLLAYVFVGRNWRVKSKKKKIVLEDIERSTQRVLKPLLKKEPERVHNLLQDGSDFQTKKIYELINENSGPESVLVSNNSIQVLQNGSEKFPALMEDLKKAKEFIHMEYFIWRSDELTEEVKDILIEKARKGVKIKIVFDPLGATLTKRSYINEMRSAGIDMRYFFNTLAPLKITTVNHLLHRKIVVIDGKIGYTGGMNMGQEYFDGGKAFDCWRDTSIKVTGEAVHVLQALIAENWQQMTKSNELFEEKYFPVPKEEVGNVPIQMVASGPSSQWDSIRQLFFSMIMTAEKKIRIQSPYFIPDDSVFEALKTAALSGVDVQVMTAGVTDSKISHWAAFTFMEELLKAGVKFHFYQKGFIHAKTISVDGKICTIGTTNLDVRSFHIAHEVNTVIFDEKIARELEEDFENDLRDCTSFTLKEYRAISPLQKFRNSLIRLFAPQM